MALLDYDDGKCGTHAVYALGARFIAGVADALHEGVKVYFWLPARAFFSSAFICTFLQIFFIFSCIFYSFSFQYFEFPTWIFSIFYVLFFYFFVHLLVLICTAHAHVLSVVFTARNFFFFIHCLHGLSYQANGTFILYGSNMKKGFKCKIIYQTNWDKVYLSSPDYLFKVYIFC